MRIKRKHASAVSAASSQVPTAETDHAGTDAPGTGCVAAPDLCAAT